MTSDIAVIALIHGIPIVYTRFQTNNKVVLAIVAIVMAIIAVATGASRYTPFDLFAVGAAYYCCTLQIWDSKATNQQSTTGNPSSKRTGDSDTFIGGLALIAIVGFFYFKHSDKPTAPLPSQSISQASSPPVPQPKQSVKPSSPRNDTAKAAPIPNVTGRIQTLAADVNSGVPKPFGDHLTIISASANGNALNISMRLNNHTAADLDAQLPLAKFNHGIAQYYCGSDPYQQLIRQGATIVVNLYGKDSGAIGTYPISVAGCEK